MTGSGLYARQVPLTNASITDAVFEVKRPTTVAEARAPSSPSFPRLIVQKRALSPPPNPPPPASPSVHAPPPPRAAARCLIRDARFAMRHTQCSNPDADREQTRSVRRPAQVNGLLKAAAEGPLKGILGFETEPLVSTAERT